jgi:hypothetical protein
MAAPFPGHSHRRQESGTRNLSRNTETAAYQDLRARTRQVDLPVNQQTDSKPEWLPRDVQRHRGALLRYGTARRSTRASIPKAHSTIATYKRYLARWVLPRWGEQTALTIQPLELETWLKELGKSHGLKNQSRAKIRQVMALVYKHAQRVGFLPRTEEANPMRFVRQSTASNFEPIIVTPTTNQN